MNLFNNIKTFLYDKTYFITFYEEAVHIYGYEEILKFNEDILVFKFKTFKLILKGNDFLVKKLLDKEILVYGLINNMSVIYE